MIRTIAGRVSAAALILVAAIFASVVIPGADAQFAGQSAFGTEATGAAANAQIINLANVTALQNILGVTISFKVGATLTNSGPTTLVVNTVNTGSPTPIERMNSGTLMQLGGAEMPAGKIVRMFYDGAEFVLETDYTGGEPVGSTKIINYTTADPGYVLETGGCLVQTAEPALFAKYGTQYNTQDGCPSGQFGVDNKKGRELAGADSMGGSAQNILTLCSSTVGAICGVQSSVVAQANLAPFSMSGNGSGSISGTASGNFTATGSAAAGLTVNGNASGSDLTCCLITGAASPLGVSVSGFANLGLSGNASTSDSINSGGGNSALSLIQPAKIVYYEAKL